MGSSSGVCVCAKCALVVQSDCYSLTSYLNDMIQYPHSVQQLLSGEQTPLLAGVIPVFEVFLTGWEKLAQKKKHLAPFIQCGLDRAREYYSRLDKSNAYVVAMCTFFFYL